MKWYHYTGIPELKAIVADEALLSFYESLRKQAEDPVVVDEFLRKSTPCENEYRRNNNVFYTPDNTRPKGIRGNDVVLGIELDQKPNYLGILTLPEVSLDNLVDIGVKPQHFVRVKEMLSSVHGGKYADRIVYQMSDN